MDKYVFFWQVSEPYGEFSNWYKSPFTVEGIAYCCCEQYMMGKKALLFGDTRTYNKIMASSDPREIKALGKEVKPFDSALWNTCKEEIVFNANLAKFSQNSVLREKLIMTDDAVIAEASPKDCIWGIKMSAKDPGVDNPENWKGENLLGKALMKVREELNK